MIYAGILAGGNIGNRDAMPLQFGLLGEKPILIHTLEQFILNGNIDQILIAVPKEWIVHTESLINNYYPDLKIKVIEDGANKNLSIVQFAKYIDGIYGVEDEDIILCHDAIRPFVTQRIIDDNIEAVKLHNIVNTVVLPVDTMVLSAEREVISAMPERGTVLAEQTPQTFKLKVMKELIERINIEDIQKIDDAAKMFFNYGQSVHLVWGEYSNIKIATSYDIEVANALLRDKKSL